MQCFITCCLQSETATVKNAYKHHLRAGQVCRLCDWLMQQESSSVARKEGEGKRRSLFRWNPAEIPSIIQPTPQRYPATVEAAVGVRVGGGTQRHPRPQAPGPIQQHWRLQNNRFYFFWGNVSGSLKHHSWRMLRRGFKGACKKRRNTAD